MGATEGGAEARRKRLAYRCFLVRCRLEETAGKDSGPSWRFTVQQVGPHAARRSFSGLEDVAIYIEAELDSGAFGKEAVRDPASK